MIKKKIKRYISRDQISFAIDNPILAIRSFFLKLSLKMNRVKREKLKAEMALLVSSGFLDPVFYLQKYPDVKKYRAGLVKHYYYHGYKEGRHPHANFNEVFFASIHSANKGSESS